MIARLLLAISILLAVHVNAGEVRWYLLDNTHASIPDLEALALTKPEIFLYNTISKVYSDDNTLVLVKVPDAYSGVREYMATQPSLIAVYDIYSHGQVINMLNTDPNWSNTRTNVE